MLAQKLCSYHSQSSDVFLKLLKLQIHTEVMKLKLYPNGMHGDCIKKQNFVRFTQNGKFYAQEGKYEPKQT